MFLLLIYPLNTLIHLIATPLFCEFNTLYYNCFTAEGNNKNPYVNRILQHHLLNQSILYEKLIYICVAEILQLEVPK